MENDNATGGLNQTDVNSLIDQKISSDTDFQASLSDLSQEDADIAIADKKAELIKQEYSSLAEKAKKNEELAKNYKVRAEKAEAGIKKEPEPAKESTVSIADLHALRDIHEDDIEEVQEYAKFKSISIKDALKTGVVKTLLAEKEEQRKVANATNTGSSRRGTSKMSDDAFLEEASKGNLPTDDEGIARLAKLNANKRN